MVQSRVSLGARTSRAARTALAADVLVATGAIATMSGVPAISRFFGVVITMFFDDHGPAFSRPPCRRDGQGQHRTLEVIESTLARRHLRFVLAWAELHQEELLENWRLARAGERLREIEPLR
jgi:hypothetical protein